MLWALVINICLSDGVYAECKEYRAEPFATWYDCRKERARLEAELTDLEHEYVRFKCVKGLYS